MFAPGVIYIEQKHLFNQISQLQSQSYNQEEVNKSLINGETYKSNYISKSTTQYWGQFYIIPSMLSEKQFDVFECIRPILMCTRQQMRTTKRTNVPRRSVK